MKKVKFILSLIVGTFALSLLGQNIEISFTGDNNGQSVTLDSILVRNVTQGGEVMLYPPDLSLILIITGIEEGMAQIKMPFELSQNYPNPCKDQTSVVIQMSESENLEIVISNILGQKLLGFNKILDAGEHTFTFTPGHQTCYFLTINCLEQSKTIKMLCYPGNLDQTIGLSHTNYTASDPVFKNRELKWELPYVFGDELLMIGFSELGESGMVKSPETSQEYIIQYATNVACPGLDSLLYGAQWYHTIQIGGQCWMKENMNIGEMISGSQSQTNNGTIEKYCYANQTTKCDALGGLYTWDELMQYSTENRTQGICPDGWHIPTDEEFKVLEGMVDANFTIGNTVWDNNGWRGFNASTNLKSTSGWMNNGNGTDMYGYRLLATGYWFEGGFSDLTEGTTLYSSTRMNTNPWYRGFHAMMDKVLRNLGIWNSATAVRCIKD